MVLQVDLWSSNLITNAFTDEELAADGRLLLAPTCLLPAVPDAASVCEKRNSTFQNEAVFKKVHRVTTRTFWKKHKGACG